MGDEAGLGAATMILEGDPAESIIQAVSKEGYDLVVVGNRGMTGAKAMLLGSVPRDVAEYAPCDVLVARTIAQSLSEIGPGEGGIVASGRPQGGGLPRREGQRSPPLSAKCTHMGCTVKWNAAERTFDCPCHGSRYSTSGTVVNGPAERAAGTDRPVDR